MSSRSLYQKTFHTSGRTGKAIRHAQLAAFPATIHPTTQVVCRDFSWRRFLQSFEILHPRRGKAPCSHRESSTAPLSLVAQNSMASAPTCAACHHEDILTRSIPFSEPWALISKGLAPL